MKLKDLKRRYGVGLKPFYVVLVDGDLHFYAKKNEAVEYANYISDRCDSIKLAEYYINLYCFSSVKDLLNADEFYHDKVADEAISEALFDYPGRCEVIDFKRSTSIRDGLARAKARKARTRG